jgi:predicted transcriptional regulator
LQIHCHAPNCDKKQHNRSQNDIIADILKAALDGASKTKILYQAFMSFNHLTKEYLPLLLANDMLEYNAEGQTYRTTKKGKEFLDAYEQLRL